MFYRGQRIIITESSASSRAHPNVGDVGYLNNAFIFPLDKFIICDAYFCKYDKDKESRRVEKKRFALNLGMNSKTSHAFLTGIGKDVIRSAIKFHLNPIYYDLLYYDLSEHPEFISPWGIWNSNLDSKTKLAKCVIRPTNEKMDMSKTPKYEIKAWFRTFLPVVFAVECLIGVPPQRNAMSRKFFGIAREIFSKNKVGSERRGHTYDLKNLNDPNLLPKLRKMQSLSALILHKTDKTHLVESFKNYQNKIRLIFKSHAFEQILTNQEYFNKTNDMPDMVLKLVIGAYLRTIFCENDSLRLFNLLDPYLHPMTSASLRKLMDLRRGVVSSASLDRFLEELLIH